jgi:hypothetical protein
VLDHSFYSLYVEDLILNMAKFILINLFFCISFRLKILMLYSKFTIRRKCQHGFGQPVYRFQVGSTCLCHMTNMSINHRPHTFRTTIALPFGSVFVVSTLDHAVSHTELTRAHFSHHIKTVYQY